MSSGNKSLAAAEVDDDDHISYFDELPRELRDFVNEAPYVQSARALRDALAAGWPASELVRQMREGMMAGMASEQVRVWGEQRPVSWETCGPLRSVKRGRS